MSEGYTYLGEVISNPDWGADLQKFATAVILGGALLYCGKRLSARLSSPEAIEKQIERFAPGFRDCVLARHTMNCADFERYNPNLIGGDVVGGVADWRQLFTRPVARWKPHTTPAKDIFLCSASTPPGGGVHGMCGFHAAKEALGSALR